MHQDMGLEARGNGERPGPVGVAGRPGPTWPLGLFSGCRAQRAAGVRPLAAGVCMSSQGHHREGTSALSIRPLTQKTHFKECIPNTRLPRDKRNGEPPACREHLLCAWPVLAFNHISLDPVSNPRRQG